MTHLRQLMIEELRRRNFAETTIRSYVHGVEHFSAYFHRRPDQLGPEHIRQYQAMLFSKLKFSPNTVGQRLGALRFFYIKVLKKSWSVAETPYPRKVIRLPEILSRKKWRADRLRGRSFLSDPSDDPLWHRGTAHGSAHLKVVDIDSRRMVVHIHGGKGRDRDVMLSQAARCVSWLLARIGASRLVVVPRQPRHTGSGRPITAKVLWNLSGHAAERAGFAIVISTRTRFGIASRRTYWKRVPICARFRCCSVIGIWKRRPSICTCRTDISAQLPVLWMH